MNHLKLSVKNIFLYQELIILSDQIFLDNRVHKLFENILMVYYNIINISGSHKKLKLELLGLIISKLMVFIILYGFFRLWCTKQIFIFSRYCFSSENYNVRSSCTYAIKVSWWLENWFSINILWRVFHLSNELSGKLSLYDLRCKPSHTMCAFITHFTKNIGKF